MVEMNSGWLADLISRLDIFKKKISGLEYMSTETSYTKRQREEIAIQKTNGKEHVRMLGQHQKVYPMKEWSGEKKKTHKHTHIM